MRVGFAGTPEFAARALAAILEAGYTIPLCLTQPDRPKGRGLKVDASPVKALALDHRIPLFQPATLKSDDARQSVVAMPVDVLVVAAYGLLLPADMLEWPRYGCLNIHASLLPRWRGAAPIQRAIEAGDSTTGITIMRMDAGLDTGPIVMSVETPIASGETAGTLSARLAALGARAIVDVLDGLSRDHTLSSTPQPPHGVTYAPKIERAERIADWLQPPAALERKLRSLDPVPGVAASLDGVELKLWAAEVLAEASESAPGTVVRAGYAGIDVACGPTAPRGTLRITELQPAGGRRMAAGAYLAGRAATPGTRLVSPR